MDEDLALELAARAADGAERLNQLMDSAGSRSLGLDDDARSELLDRIAKAASSLSGCISMIGADTGVDPAAKQYLSRVSERIWESVKGLLNSLVTPGGCTLAEDPEALLRAKVAEIAWDAGAQDGLRRRTPGRAVMEFGGNERTTRRAVAVAKARWRAGHRRTYRPWITEPGLWVQWDWGKGPVVPGPDGEPRGTVLFCAWLAWSRFRGAAYLGPDPADADRVPGRDAAADRRGAGVCADR